MQLSVEPETSIALQVAVTIGRVARFDYPRDWPTLLTDLLGSLQSNDMDILRCGNCSISCRSRAARVPAPSPIAGLPPRAPRERRVYLVLHHVLKELASKRLMGDQQTFYAICQDIFQYVWTLWCQYTENVAALVPSAAANPEAAREVLPKTERWLLLVRRRGARAAAGQRTERSSGVSNTWLLPDRASRDIACASRRSSRSCGGSWSTASLQTPAPSRTCLRWATQPLSSCRPSRRCSPRGWPSHRSPPGPSLRHRQVQHHCSAPAGHSSMIAGWPTAFAIHPPQVVAMLDRGVLKIVKSLKDIQEAHPWSFRLNGALAVVSDSLISHVSGSACHAQERQMPREKRRVARKGSSPADGVRSHRSDPCAFVPTGRVGSPGVAGAVGQQSRLRAPSHILHALPAPSRDLQGLRARICRPPAGDRGRGRSQRAGRRHVPR